MLESSMIAHSNRKNLYFSNLNFVFINFPKKTVFGAKFIENVHFRPKSEIFENSDFVKLGLKTIFFKEIVKMKIRFEKYRFLRVF